MKKKQGKSNSDSPGENIARQDNWLEELQYPPGEDIYSNEEKLPLSAAVPGEAPGSQPTASAGDDLDIPGTELDDADEAIGEEDEENNYYSLGGDNHNDLEEDKDE